MHRRRTVGALAATTAVVVSMAGCGTSTGGSGDAVAFTDQICGSFIGLVVIASRPPDVSSSDPLAARKALSGYLRDGVGSVNQAITLLDGAGKSPVAGGDELVAKAKASLAKTRTTFDKLRATLDSAPGVPVPGEVATITRTLPAVVGQLKAQNPYSAMRANAGLSEAAGQAPNCQEINTIGK